MTNQTETQVVGPLAVRCGCSQWSVSDRIACVRRGLEVDWLDAAGLALGWPVDEINRWMRVGDSGQLSDRLHLFSAFALPQRLGR
jgi:hypothetical protein